MKKIGIYLLLFVFGITVNAQKAKVIQAWTKMDSYISTGLEDVEALTKARDLIDVAVEHETTKSSSKAFLYRGKIYLLLSAREDTILSNNATEIAFTSFKKVLNLEDASSKKKKYSEDAIFGILSLVPNFHNKGLNCYTAEDFNCAFNSFSNLLEISELSIVRDVNNATIDTSAVLAVAYSAERIERPDVAIEMYKQLIDLKYDDASIYSGISRIFGTMGEKEEANKYISLGLEKYPGDKNLNIEKVNMFLSSDNSEEVIISMENLIASDSTNATLYYTLGVAYDEEKNFEKSIKNYQKAIELDTIYFNAFYNLGAVYYNQVTAKYVEMNDLSIDDEVNYDRLKKETEELFMKALPYLETAHKLDKDDAGTIKALKEIYARTNQLEKMSDMKKKYDALGN